ncbi:hypothetical protein TNCV_1571851 [Trichonephila clavipes]|uniref:Uncharacterized protein n=1 Tax=Trichonephila clavipes TaxID=2585209 RepID=A0A8X6SKE8_TRICX|nr:hypothetical protein TNCV_1571851 [Trichonephila clavipes]
MSDDNVVKKILQFKVTGIRKRGRPRLRWTDLMESDSMTINEKTGRTKSLVYADKPQTLDPLEDNIRRVIADIRPQMLEKVIENWTFRLDYIRASHMPEIIFKM